MSKQTWTIAGVLSAVIIVGVLGYFLYAKQTELQQAKEELTTAKRAVAQSQAESGDLGTKLSASQGRVKALEAEMDAVRESRKGLEKEMRTALESKDVTISELQGKLTVNILDRILFDSGEAELKPAGEDVLRKVGAILKEHPTLKVHVVGHTDDVPIRASARKRFASNWELSTLRATAAVRFLTEQAGVDPRHLGAVGYGEFRPVADNTTEVGRAKNRRIAITILSEELAGSDAVATVSTNTVIIAPRGGQEGASVPQAGPAAPTNTTAATAAPAATNATTPAPLSPAPATTNAPPVIAGPVAPTTANATPEPTNTPPAESKPAEKKQE